MWTRDPEDELLSLCAELGIAFVAYSPLGRGFLTGAIRSVEDLPPGDWRRSNPRFQEEALSQNLRLVDAVQELARQKGCTVGQIALAWVLARGEHIVPIPGTRRSERLAENADAVRVALTPKDLDDLDAIAPAGIAVGDRYPEAGMRSVGR